MVLLAILNGLGSLLPDIDCQYSTIGKHFKSINKYIPHRNGFTHSLLASFMWCSVGLGLGYRFSYEYFWVMWIGFISHLVLDSFTPMGVKWLYPLGKSYSLGIGKNGSWIESAMCLSGLMVIYYEWIV